MSTAKQTPTDRAMAIVFSQASGQRVLADEVYPKDADLAGFHHGVGDRLSQLARRAPEIWADEDRKAATAATAAAAVEGS